MNFSACLKLQNVFGNSGYSSSVFISLAIAPLAQSPNSPSRANGGKLRSSASVGRPDPTKTFLEACCEAASLDAQGAAPKPEGRRLGPFWLEPPAREERSDSARCISAQLSSNMDNKKRGACGASLEPTTRLMRVAPRRGCFPIRKARINSGC
jgi:hypothetical protein